MNQEWHLHKNEAKHIQAWNQQGELYKRVLDQRSPTNQALEILDFGCGQNASSRRHFQSLISGSEHCLSLYDQSFIRPPAQKNVKIISAADVLGPGAKEFDIINFSYVFCLMKDEDARCTLQKLIGQNPRASFVIIDYILKGRGNNEVLRLLNAEEERKWLGMLGEEEFCRVHAHFDQESLKKLCLESGLALEKSELLDTANVRMGIVAKPASQNTVMNQAA